MEDNKVVVSQDARAPRPVSSKQLVIPPEETARRAEYDSVLGRVRLLLIEQLHLRKEEDEIDPDAVLFGTGLGLDSVDAVELTVAVESEFGVGIPDGEKSRTIFRTVNSLVDHIQRSTEAKGNTNVA